MGIPIDREGVFRCEIFDYGLKEQESGSVAVSIAARILQCWDDEAQEWVDWTENEAGEALNITAQGDLYVVKKDGTLNQCQVDALGRYAGWDGSFETIAGRTWNPVKCQCVVEADEYKGQRRFRIEWINDWERVPGQLGSVDERRAKELQTRFGGQLRAAMGNGARNAAAPGGKPAPPPPASTSGRKPAKQQQAAKPQPGTPTEQELDEAAGDDIPF